MSPRRVLFSPQNMPPEVWNTSFWDFVIWGQWVHLKFCYAWFVALKQIGMSIRMANAVCMSIRISCKSESKPCNVERSPIWPAPPNLANRKGLQFVPPNPVRWGSKLPRKVGGICSLRWQLPLRGCYHRNVHKCAWLDPWECVAGQNQRLWSRYLGTTVVSSLPPIAQRVEAKESVLLFGVSRWGHIYIYIYIYSYTYIYILYMQTSNTA